MRGPAHPIGRGGSGRSRGRRARGARIINDDTKAEMRRILNEIQTGRFAAEWVSECMAGQPSFKAMRRRAAEHPIEEVGDRLRAMMPWIAESRLVDKEKN